MSGLADQASLTSTFANTDVIPAVPGFDAQSVLMVPIMPTGRNQILAFLMLAHAEPLDSRHQALLDELLPLVALNLEIFERNRITQDLLAQTQQQAHDLQQSETVLQMQQQEP